MDADSWQTFLKAYFAADRDASPGCYGDQVQLQGASFVRTAGTLRPVHRGHGLSTSRPLRDLCDLTSGGADRVYLAHPKHSLEATRKDPQAPWEIRVDPRVATPHTSIDRIAFSMIDPQ